MIDFRYHLISLVAVFLALGLGILMGSVVLDQTLVNDLESRLNDLKKTNNQLRGDVTDLDRENGAARAYAEASESWLLPGHLNGQKVVVFEIDGTEGATIDRITSDIETAGGDIPTTITLSSDLSLESEIARERLAIALNSSSILASDLRGELGQNLGTRAADVANAGGPEARAAVVAGQRLTDLLNSLESGDFISIDARDPDEVVPQDALFLVVGGNRSHSPFEGKQFSITLGTALAQRGLPVLLAEPSDSVWGLVPGIRNDTEARTAVSTVDQADTIAGGIAVALGLEEERRGQTGQWGSGSGATAVIPQPSPIE